MLNDEPENGLSVDSCALSPGAWTEEAIDQYSYSLTHSYLQTNHFLVHH